MNTHQLCAHGRATDPDPSTTASCGTIDLRATPGESHMEYFLSGSVSEQAAGPELAAELFHELAAILVEKGIQPIQEKLYGRAEAREEMLDIRAEVFRHYGLDPALPVTYIDGRPVSGSTFAGLQVWGVAPRGPNPSSVTTIEGVGTAPARCWRGPGFRMVYLPGVSGLTPGESSPSCPTGQANRMFDAANQALKAQGMPYTSVVRTWIYLSRLLDWYGEFNRVRTEHHARQGLCTAQGSSVFPASTGIQGRCLAGEECFMDVLALESAGTVEASPINESSRQPDAFSYGSGFSRAMKVTIEGRTLFFISGTASINAEGESVNLGDAELQSVEMLMDIAALLEGQGGTLDDICSATLFCKDVKSYQAYQDVTRLLGLPKFPTIPVLADVCRQELLLEMEAVAVI